MAWLRVGDNVNTHPLMSRLVEACEYDHSLKNEAFGLFIALATSSAAHLTDYVVEPGLVGVLAPGREKTLMDILRSSTLVENYKEEEEGRWLYRLTNDVDFVHMRSRAEVEIDRDRSRDRRNPELAIPVRVRDGDECRWCGRTVKFSDHKSARGGTIDSLNGHQESTIDTLVVACRGCNSDRKDGKPGFNLRPAPEVPYYEKTTINFINTHPWAKANDIHVEAAQRELDIPAAARVEAAPGGQAAAQEHEEAPTVAARPAPAAAPHTQAAADTDSAARPEDNETVKPERISVGYPERITGGQGDDPGLSGSGRDGTGRAGTGHGRFDIPPGGKKKARGGRKRGARGGRRR